MNELRALFQSGKNILEQGGIKDTADFEASVLFEHCYGISKPMLLLETKLPKDSGARYLDACTRRVGGYPLQYIVGSWEFYGLDFKVSPDVLIPRPDTETLIDYVLQNYSGKLSVLDMCCGSGCIGLTIKKHLPDADVTLCDISDGALAVTKENAKNLGADVTVIKADLLDGYEKYFEAGSFDIIISNPPYIKSGDMQKLSAEVRCEPHIALDGGEDGMRFYTALCEKWQGALRTGGELILESGYDTADEIVTLMTELCYSDIVTKKDFGGITRLVAAKNK